MKTNDYNDPDAIKKRQSIFRKEYDPVFGFVLGKRNLDKTTFFINAVDQNFGILKVGVFRECTFVFYHYIEDGKKFANLTVTQSYNHQILFELINQIDDYKNSSSENGIIDFYGVKEILLQKSNAFPYECLREVLLESLKCMCVFLNKKSLKYNYHIGNLKVEDEVLCMLVKLWSNKNLKKVKTNARHQITNPFEPISYNGNPRSNFHMGYQIKYSHQKVTWNDILDGVFEGPLTVGETATICDITLLCSIKKQYAKQLGIKLE